MSSTVLDKCLLCIISTMVMQNCVNSDINDTLLYTINRLRNPKPFHTVRARTNKFRKSFLPYCFGNYT